MTIGEIDHFAKYGTKIFQNIVNESGSEMRKNH